MDTRSWSGGHQDSSPAAITKATETYRQPTRPEWAVQPDMEGHLVAVRVGQDQVGVNRRVDGERHDEEGQAADNDGGGGVLRLDANGYSRRDDRQRLSGSLPLLLRTKRGGKEPRTKYTRRGQG